MHTARLCRTPSEGHHADVPAITRSCIYISLHPMSESTPDSFQTPLTSNDFPLNIARRAKYKKRISLPGMPPSLRVGGWVVDGNALRSDREALGWLRSHGFRECGGRWYRRDMTLVGLLELNTWARNAVGELSAVPQRTPGLWTLRKTSIVSSHDENIEIAQILSDDEIDADGNLKGKA